MKETEKKPSSITLPDNERTYEVDGKTFIVKPVYKEESNENFTTVLIKLITADED